jgi:hypothetical protein
VEGVTTLRNRIEFGRLVEWSIALALKARELKGSVGSNPTPSAIIVKQMKIKDYLSTRVFDGIRPLSKERADRLERTRMEKNCGCGRSPTGKCIGWHGLTNEQYTAKLQEYEKKNLTESAPQLLRD